MSTPPAAKRRRVDSLGIHKPFVSPLRRNPSSTGPSPSTAPQTNAASQTTPAPLRTQAVTTPKAIPYTPLRSSKLKTSTPLHHHTPHDPEIAQAHQDIKALEAKIRVLRSQNGILAQAAQITAPTPQASQASSSSQQASQPSQSSQQHQPQTSRSTQQPQTRLTRLSQKWLRASQSAAEEVFVSFEQSIKDNGGYTTFLAQQKRSSTSNSFFNDNFDDGKEKVDGGNEDNWRDEEGDELTERGKRQRRGMIEEQGHKQHSREGDEDEGKEEEEEEEEEEEQELTLGVMLKVLNIDPEVIAWDTKTLAWK